MIMSLITWKSFNKFGSDLNSLIIHLIFSLTLSSLVMSRILICMLYALARFAQESVN